MPVEPQENGEDRRSRLFRLQLLRHRRRERDRPVEQGERPVARRRNLVSTGGLTQSAEKRNGEKNSSHIWYSIR